MVKKILIVAFFFCPALVHAQLKWPVVTSQSKPWTRWWWEGSAVSKTGLTYNLDQYKKAGLGGVEITPIYGIHGYEKDFVSFLSPQWMQLFDHTLKEAKRMNLGVDLANATGWPFGGPWVTDDDASKTIYYKTYTVNGGDNLKDAIQYKQEGSIRTANYNGVPIDTVLQPVDANKNLQDIALDQVKFAGNLPLQSLMAYADNQSPLDLTTKVDKNGILQWTAPAGKWELYALFMGLHGKMVERAAPGGEGYAIDHFSATAAKNYFTKFDIAFKGHDLSSLRAFFNDSYEVDDARGQANWTPAFLTEFKKRVGYDLRDQLPALFGKATGETNRRVIYDYRSVIDELLLEHFTMEWKKWGVGKGKMLRNQSHGSPANTLDLYSVVDIPETEGTDILRFKFATSAANVTGKQLVSAESATWLNEHFLSSLGDVKKAIDLYFLGGVNHIVYHGSAYSPPTAPWPGWLFYAAVHFQPTNPQWKDFHTLNNYIARVQSFLQAGKPDNDVLLYYPIVDRYSEPGNTLLQHFDGMERNFEKTDFEHVSKWMLDNGYSFDFFSDRQLQHISFVNGQLVSGGNNYKTILLPNNRLIPAASMQKLMELAGKGATILFYKSPPGDIPGYSQLDTRRKQFKEIIGQLKFVPAKQTSLSMATLSRGNFFSGDDLEVLLKQTKARKETVSEKGLQLIRRKNKDGYVYFITNTSEKPVNDWQALQVNGASVALFNPMTGESGMARVNKKSKETPVETYLQLQPHESVILQTYTIAKNAAGYPYRESKGEAKKIEGIWTIEFLDGGPVIPQTVNTDKLGSWTDLAGEAVRDFSGTAKYTINIPSPGGDCLLDLGKVNETAEVFINGKKITTLIGPVFQVYVPASTWNAINKIEIIVANLMANRISYMDRNNIPWKIFYNTNMPARRRENVKNGLFDASSWKPLPSGLTGPVTITLLK